MSSAKDYPCLNKVWIILCGEYGLPKGTKFPELPHPSIDLEAAELKAVNLTMGQLSQWLAGKHDFHRSSLLKEVMYNLWNEIDNN